MGAAIRHLAMLLNQVEARTKLLITLSDGKPDDYSDNYRGEYGIEDTRQALIEAHRSGIKPFCITIDREAREYLPHMYGAVNWTLVDDVARFRSRSRTSTGGSPPEELRLHDLAGDARPRMEQP